MTEIPDPIRRAMEAAGADVARVAADIAAGLTDEVREMTGNDDLVVEYEQASLIGTTIGSEQVTLFGEGPTPISYETLLPASDVATYKRVKAWTMKLGDDAREIAARLVEGTIGDGDRSGKQFIRTREGLFRLATSHHSDNSTEQAAHERMGVETIKLSEPDEVIAWFNRHGLDGRLAYDRLVRDLRARFHA